MTRTYTRQETRWDIELLEQALSDGNAKLFVTKDGPLYVVKTEQGSFAVRTGQIIPREEETSPPPAPVFDTELAEYERLAAEQGVSVEEYTDGEYSSRGILAPGSTEEDALLAKFL